MREFLETPSFEVVVDHRIYEKLGRHLPDELSVALTQRICHARKSLSSSS